MECFCCLESCAAKFVTCRDCENTITCPHCKVLHEISLVSSIGIDEEMARCVSVDKLLMRISNDSPEKLERFKKYLDLEVSRVPNKPVPDMPYRFNDDALDATAAKFLEYLCIAQNNSGNKRTAFEMCQQEGVDSIDRAISIVNEFTDEIRTRVANKDVISERLLAFDDIYKYTKRISNPEEHEHDPVPRYEIFGRGWAMRGDFWYLRFANGDYKRTDFNYILEIQTFFAECLMKSAGRAETAILIGAIGGIYRHDSLANPPYMNKTTGAISTRDVIRFHFIFPPAFINAITNCIKEHRGKRFQYFSQGGKVKKSTYNALGIDKGAEITRTARSSIDDIMEFKIGRAHV